MSFRIVYVVPFRREMPYYTDLPILRGTTNFIRVEGVIAFHVRIDSLEDSS